MSSKLFLFIIIILCLVPQFSYAGFVTASSTTESKQKKLVVRNRSFMERNLTMVKSIFHPEGEEKKDGVVGRLSFIFGFCGFIPLIGALFSIAAIVLGAIGIKKHQKHALAGLILGAGTITLGIILTILIFAAL